MYPTIAYHGRQQSIPLSDVPWGPRHVTQSNPYAPHRLFILPVVVDLQLTIFGVVVVDASRQQGLGRSLFMDIVECTRRP